MKSELGQQTEIINVIYQLKINHVSYFWSPNHPENRLSDNGINVLLIKKNVF